MNEHTCESAITGNPPEPPCPACEDEALENFGIVWVGPVDGKGFCKGQIRLFPLEPFTKEKKGEWNGY
jgi:hypothetical protein